MATVTDDLTTPPEFQQQPKSRGCLYGCLFVVGAGIALLLCAGIGTYFFVSSQVTKYTSSNPAELPTVEFEPEELAKLETRVSTFSEAIESGEAPTEDLVLTAKELNGLLTKEDALKGKVFIKIEEGQLSGEVSIPADVFPGGKGRFFNGNASFEVSMDNGILIVTLTDAEVNGEKLPQKFVDAMAQQNLAKDIYNDPKNAKILRRFDDISIEGDKIILRARRDEPSSEEPSSDEPSSEEPGEVEKSDEADQPTESDGDSAPEEAPAEDNNLTLEPASPEA
jgi:hypothetical protein